MSWLVALKCADRLELDNRLPSGEETRDGGWIDYMDVVDCIDDEGVQQARREWGEDENGDHELGRRLAAELRRWARTSAAVYALLSEYQDAAHATARAKGWWAEHTTPSGIVMGPRDVLAMLMLITTEVAEAAEDVRTGNMLTTIEESGKPVGFPSELADIVIRVFDLAGGLGIDLQHELALKMMHNTTRTHRHGGKLA